MKPTRVSPFRLALRLLAAAAAMGWLAACVETQAPGQSDFVVADLFATPGKALATAEFSPTPQAAPTFPNLPPPTAAPTLPLPTVVVLQQPTLPIITAGPTPTLAGMPTATVTPLACATPPPMPFAPIWQNIAQAQTMMRCPVGDPQTVGGVWQAFERGVMFWRESDKTIFVISDNAIRGGQATDTWWHMADTWQEGEAESDPGLQPPAGMRQPIRGFGKVWRNNAFVREAVGWAISDEIRLDSLWQTFEGGWMMAGPNNTPIYVMQPLDAPPYTTGIHLGPQP